MLETLLAIAAVSALFIGVIYVVQTTVTSLKYADVSEQGFPTWLR